jgi:two-component system, chemotaxis family, sensor kinase CheA
MGSVDVDEEDIKAFLVESYENLAQAEQDILNLETSGDFALHRCGDLPQGLLHNRESLNRIYRALHSIKGNCGFLSFPKLEAVAHAGENLLGNLRDGKQNVTPEIVTNLLQTIDAIAQLLSAIETTSEEGKADYSELIRALEGSRKQGTEQQSKVGANGHSPLQKSKANIQHSVETIRVDIGLLDRVMNLMGELVLVRNQVIQHSTELNNDSLTTTCQRLHLITSDLQEGIMKTRMQPIGNLWRNFPRMVRDLAISCGKQVNLELDGADTELDRSILEAIKDPLTHLIRNCIDHGIETPEIRSKLGKPTTGRLRLRAFHESGKVNLEISDDGKGIDIKKLKQRAQQLGAIDSDRLETMSEHEAIELMFLPGFSTKEEVTRLSGRGVGLDVVRQNLEAINGTIDVKSQIDRGTTFQLKIPLTLAIISALLVSSGKERFAIAQNNLQEIVRIEGKEEIDRSIETFYNVPVYRLRGKILPLIYLDRVLQLKDIRADPETLNIVVINADEYAYGLVIDRVYDTQEIVVKPLGKQLKALTIYAGATILGDGSIALILDAIGLARKADLQQGIESRGGEEQQKQQEQQKQFILIIKGPQDTRMGIILNHAIRLEEIPITAIERLGEQYVVQYCDRILSLIDLHLIFTGKIREITKLQSDCVALSVVVVTLNENYTVGLIVDKILDVVEETLTVKASASRSGVQCYATVQGQITEILDLEAIVKIKQ